MYSSLILFLFYFLGEQGVVIGFLNSFVHIFMYFYYMLAAMGPSYRKYLWWKKYITWIQLIQFTIMLSYLMLIVYLDCKLHRALTVFFMVNVSIFLYLFSSFYIKAYSKGKIRIATVDQTKKPLENIDPNKNVGSNNDRAIIHKLVEFQEAEDHDVYVGSLKGAKKMHKIE